MATGINFKIVEQKVVVVRFRQNRKTPWRYVTISCYFYVIFDRKNVFSSDFDILILVRQLLSHNFTTFKLLYEEMRH